MVSFLSLEVGLLLISIIIASLSFVVSGFSYTGQLTAQTRETLEQLDDTNLGSTYKVKYYFTNTRYLMVQRHLTFEY